MASSYLHNTLSRVFRLPYASSLWQIRKLKLGDDHLDVGEVHHNMGDVNYLNSEFNEALANYTVAFRIRFFKLGSDNVDVAATKNNMGVVHLKRGDNDHGENSSVTLHQCLILNNTGE